MLLGASGLGHMPVTVRLGPKEARLPAGQARWHAIKLSPEQALADRSRISLEVCILCASMQPRHHQVSFAAVQCFLGQRTKLVL